MSSSNSESVDTKPVASDLVERLLLVEDGVWRNPEGEEAAAAIITLQGEIQELNKLLADGANGRTLAAEAEVARLKAELAEGCDLLDRFDGHLPAVRRYLERVRSFLDGQKTGEKG